jgi:4-amino-4-deoxy-L-arabinose transferase-like glycosyltransferase
MKKARGNVSSLGMYVRRRSRLAILIPIALAGFTHLWNPVGFPDIFYDEGVYMRRVLHVMEGLGPQEASFYDHPYFGQLFLAGVLGAIGYPDSQLPSANEQSVALLYAVPRIVMGLLAVADTILIYKLAEHRYNRRVALLASIFFAVLPMSWLTRRILLDSILLPFLLASMLFALYGANRVGNKKLVLILLSGAFLGVSIFTKIPIFIMIPAVGYLVYSSLNRKKLRTIGLWFIPVILIPLIWPLYSLSLGQLDFWFRDVLWQTQRQSEGFVSIVESFFAYDPALMILGLSGAVYALMKKDLYLLLWTVPFTIFLAVIGYVQYFHWIPLLPVFCIASARLVERFTRSLRHYTAVLAGIMIFGLVSTALLITSNLTSAQFQAIAFAADIADDKTTVVSSPVYSWIFLYVFDREYVFTDYRDLLFHPVETDKMLLISDRHFQSNIGAGSQLQEAYNSTANIAVFEGDALHYDSTQYPFTSILANYEGSVIEVRTN